MKQNQRKLRSAALLTAAALTVAWVPSFAVTAVPYHTWTGYVLRGGDQYLSVFGGAAEEAATVDWYAADGAAAYNTWYITEEDSGITIKSALSQGEYYLALKDGGLVISKTATVFQADEAALGYLLGSMYPALSLTDVVLEAVTNLHAGDVNQDDRIDGKDLALLRQMDASKADFVQKAMGDVNGDGVLNQSDITLLQQYLLGTAVDFAAVTIPTCTILPENPAVTGTTTNTTEALTETTTRMTTVDTTEVTSYETTVTSEPIKDDLTMADFPAEYQTAADWIWENRISVEKSTARWNTIFDQIAAGDGTLNYVVRWQSYKTITLEQRQQLEQVLSESVNGWTNWLAGYDGWKYDHVDVNIVGWAVLDKSVLQDLQPDEVVYDNLISDYDSTYDTSNGVETIPTLLPSAPTELSRFDHYAESGYVYPGGLDSRFDMYLWATQGFPSIGGCGGDWGQRLSDDAYLNMLDGTGIHVLEHEIGHGFGMTDFYGGEGESDGFPPGGFPGGENSIMMAGSSMKITDFDGWMLRYMWSQVKNENGRFS